MTSTAHVPVMPLLPSPEEQLLRAAVSQVARRFGPDYHHEVTRAEADPDDLWLELGHGGFLGVHLPEAHGGGGAGLHELGMVVEETAAAGVPALSAVFSSGVNGTILTRHGTPEQKRRWLPGLASGETRSSFAITEPDAGHNSHRVATTARRDGDGWVLSGQKYYVSGFDASQWVLVVARTGVQETTGRGALSLFLVDSDAPGISHRPLPTELQIPERQATVHFDDVRLSPDRLVGREGHGLATAFAGMDAERLLVSSICTGLGRYALEKAVNYARHRAVWSAPIGAHQGIAHPLAAAKIELETARLMTTRAYLLHDAGHEPAESANMAKLTGVDAGLACLDAAIQTHGGNGVATEYRLANYWFLLRTLKIGPVSREMILNFVAQHTLGLPRSY